MMAESKGHQQSSLEWNIEAYSSRNVEEGSLLSTSSFISSCASRSECSIQSLIEQDIQTFGTNGTTLHSLSAPIPIQDGSMDVTQRVPFPMSDLHHTISPVTIHDMQPTQPSFLDPDQLSQTPIVQEYPYRQPSPYPQETYHELRPPDEVERRVSPTSSFSPRERTTSSSEAPTYSSNSPRSEDFYGCEVPRPASSFSGRRPRRSRKTTLPHSPYRKEYRHLGTRSSQPSAAGRPRKPRNSWGRHSRGSSYSSRSPPTSLGETSEFGTDSILTGNGSCTEFQFDKDKVFVEIIEQPQPKALRFRYICEGRSAGSIPGVNSSPENKTYPTIKIVNYKGPVLAVVSCVTVNPPHRPHPHNLVGKDGCEGGVCSVVIDSDSMICSFSNLGIQCVKKKDVEKSLLRREEKNVDPYNTGFSHRNQPQNIDLNAVRLCFQVYIKDRKTGDHIPINPIVSEPIFDKKATADLVINKLSDCSSSAYGGREIILLCDKVTKEDVQVRFFELKDGRVVWEDFGEFQASDVHKQVAITFKTPSYRNLDIKNPVNVCVQLCRPSDNCTSEPRPFLYYPLDTEQSYIHMKLEGEMRDYFMHGEQLNDADTLLTPNYYSDSQARLARPSSAKSKKTKPPRSVSPYDEPDDTLESFSSQTSSTPRGQKHAKSRMRPSTPTATSYSTLVEPISSHENVYQPQLHYPSSSSKDLEYDQSKNHSYSTSRTLDPTEVYTNPSTVSHSVTNQEDILDLDSQHLVPSIDALPDLGLISTRDLYNTDNSLTSLALSGIISQSEVRVSTPSREDGGYGCHSLTERREILEKATAELSVNTPRAARQKSFEEDESCSSQSSESVKKLKLDLETLNKLSR